MNTQMQHLCFLNDTYVSCNLVSLMLADFKYLLKFLIHIIYLNTSEETENSVFHLVCEQELKLCCIPYWDSEEEKI